MVIEKKSEILFLYESVYSIPNGDPFTGEQRYDEETKKILVSDVRIKRFIRDYFVQQNELAGGNKYDVYVWNDGSQGAEKESGAAARMKGLKKKYENDESVKSTGKGKKNVDARKLMCKCIDVRLFGGISTEKDDAVNLTGPIQFALLNPSLNEVELRMHQNTSIFSSNVAEKSRGAIGTTTLVPYSVNQIHGWINPFSARHTELSDADVELMFQAIWESIDNANTRSKCNQSSLLLLQIVYSHPTDKIYGLDRLVRLVPRDDRRGEQLRSIDDFELDFSALLNAANQDKVAEVQYFSAIVGIEQQFQNIKKFKKMQFTPEDKK